MREQAFLNAGVTIVLRDERCKKQRDAGIAEAAAMAYNDEEEPAEDILEDNGEGIDNDEEECKVQEDVLCYEGGIKSFVEYLNEHKHSEPVHSDVVYMCENNGYTTAEVALQYNTSYNETILSFANNVVTPDGGTHETGFKSALTKAINDYARKTGVLKESDTKLTGEDVREGICAVISVKLTEAQFEGQTKGKLGNSEIRTFVDNLVSRKLEEYFEENPNSGHAILDKALQACRAERGCKKGKGSYKKKKCA